MTTYAARGRDGSQVDVKLIAGRWTCQKCILTARKRRDRWIDVNTFVTTDIPHMLDHLDFHALLGHHVPAGAFERLRADHADRFEKGAR